MRGISLIDAVRDQYGRDTTRFMWSLLDKPVELYQSAKTDATKVLDKLRKLPSDLPDTKAETSGNATEVPDTPKKKLPSDLSDDEGETSDAEEATVKPV